MNHLSLPSCLHSHSMALSKTCSGFLLIILSFFAYLLSCNCLCIIPSKQDDGLGRVKGMFVFGGSLIDNGNNNVLPTSAKGNYPPYGIDFPLGPTGRLTNGKNVIDLLGDHLRLTLLPPFTDPATKGDKILHGVDYASAASGILDDTGSVAGTVIPLSQQIRNFEGVTLPDLEAQTGCTSNQLLPYYIVMVYSLGGRKFVLLGIIPLGCIPAVLRSQPTGQCSQIRNHAAQLFNDRLRQLVDIARFQLPGSLFVFVNSYQIIINIINNPSIYGFSDATDPCCEVPTMNEGGNGISCKRDGQVCGNRNAYVFFDGLHPTEAVNVMLADRAFSSPLISEVYPINVNLLAFLG
ncbi:GDSL lipase/esterase [Dillenia turbinata]|uniref:GDSL lipase/esterase n=1 Tax=Dillenia turbinata TaxID=194707 RepID=A0AAN8VZ66_9MAGN